MSKEFFVRDWLKDRPLLYMFSHMMIMPLVDFYATACDWWPADHEAPHGLLWFVVVSYFNGIVIEVGRKIRAPEDEEVGVNTYSFLWGRRNAALFWLTFLCLTAISAARAAFLIDFFVPVVVVLCLLLALAIYTVVAYLRRPSTTTAKRIEHVSGIWTLLLYLNLGIIPLLWRHWFE
jgi:4-hydroxybenzoate polyprenyltransferase